MLTEFKAFAMKGNVVDMAVGVVIGGAFGAIVKSLVDDVIMPVVGRITGGVDFSNLFLVLKDGATAGPYLSVAEAAKSGAVLLKYGSFINTVVTFLIVAFAIFLVIKNLNRFKREEAAPPPPGPSEEVLLLREIRDALKK
ncbi:MAG: large conductance mechanosensitive channel protein MscL [Betaproteobacteria bacterium]|nr:large conductance mechanosensitive channel protein MscL [Betaproteobacteria bacterium]